ncbi:MAG: mannitol 2-dehydrogenase [Actinomycetota bacterium]|jgi:mannitol 2-dehydrogenase|nr:mannitol 2-dehydrogenase [Actinomycetota bacterium]
MTLARPGYPRDELTAGIVHLGFGAFARSHLAMYVDRMLAAGAPPEWGICGVGLLPADARLRDGLRKQDHTYTLLLKYSDGQLTASTIGSACGYLHAPDEPRAVVDLMAAASTRIVSLTVTEGGWSTEDPAGVFDLVLQALAARRDRGLPAFTVLSCDNIEGNGEVARRVVLGLAEARDPALAQWLADEGAFPSSMVDRITPGTTDADRALVRERFGVDDDVPVVAEPFAQWVIEDRFCAGRPPFEDAGALLVADVRPYEQLKLRLLNAGHQALGHFGVLLGHATVHEAAADPLAVALLRRWFAEAVPTLLPVPGVDLAEYQETLLARFANPHIVDPLSRITAYASDRIPAFVLPAVRDNLAAGRRVDVGAAIVAAWAHGLEWFQPVDNCTLAGGAALMPANDVFGELASTPAFTEPFYATLAQLQTVGAASVLRVLTR